MKHRTKAVPSTIVSDSWQMVALTPAPEWRADRSREILQIYGNDEHDNTMRVVPGYFDRGQAIGMDEMTHYPFKAVAWRHLAIPPDA